MSCCGGCAKGTGCAGGACSVGARPVRMTGGPPLPVDRIGFVAKSTGALFGGKPDWTGAAPGPQAMQAPSVFASALENEARAVWDLVVRFHPGMTCEVWNALPGSKKYGLVRAVSAPASETKGRVPVQQKGIVAGHKGGTPFTLYGNDGATLGGYSRDPNALELEPWPYIHRNFPDDAVIAAIDRMCSVKPAGLPDADMTITPEEAGIGGGSSSSNQAAREQAIGAAVVGSIGSVGNTILSLVREANQSDARAQQAALAASTARIAQQQSREQALVAAVTEANGAAFDADTALRQLSAGNRAQAIATLSAAQGRLAAAIGAAAVPDIGTNPALTSALGAGRSHVGAAAAQVDASAPPSIQPVVNPYQGLTLPPPSAGMWQRFTDWVSTTTAGKVVVGGAAVLAAGYATGLIGGRRSPMHNPARRRHHRRARRGRMA